MGSFISTHQQAFFTHFQLIANKFFRYFLFKFHIMAYQNPANGITIIFVRFLVPFMEKQFFLRSNNNET